jgi:hypothetical protein
MVPHTLGVIENRHYISLAGGVTALSFLDERSRDVHAWYQGHRTSEHAGAFAELYSKHA